jgi:hypothetical protein
MDLATQKSDRVLPDFSVVDYAVSRDEQEVAVTTPAADRSLDIWVAALDRRTAPRRIVQGGDRVAFGAKRDLLFRSIEGHANFVTRIGLDGQNRVRLSEVNAIDLMDTSPDGQWVSFAGAFGSEHFGVAALPIYGGEPKILCYSGCRPAWSPDARSLYLSTGIDPPHPILVVPLQPGQAFPAFPASGAEAEAAWRKLPAAHVIERPTSIPGLDESTYVVTRTEEHRNLFRVPLPR